MTDLLDVAAGDDRPRPVLLGEAPSKTGDRFHEFPLSGRPAKVLCELAGIPPQAEGTQYGRWTWALYERFECRNVFRRYADATPWSAPPARVVARQHLTELEAEARSAAWQSANIVSDAAIELPATVIVCLGRRVQAAVLGALGFRYITTAPRAWATGVFGDFGVWVAPWHIETPTIRYELAPIAAADFAPGAELSPVPAGAKVPERRWAPHVVTIPHPSGLNRLLNDEAQRAQCGEVLRRALELAQTTTTVTV